MSIPQNIVMDLNSAMNELNNFICFVVNRLITNLKFYEKYLKYFQGL